MHNMRLNVRLATLLVATVAAVLVASSLAPTPRQAFADHFTPEGVMCFELSGLATGIGLVRVNHDIATNDLTFTSQVYIEDTLAVPDCQNAQAAIPADAVPFPDREGNRTSLPGSWNTTTHQLTAVVCQPDLNFGPLEFDFAEVDVVFDIEKAPTKSSGTFTLRGPFTDAGCTLGTPNTFDVDVAGAKYLAGNNADPSSENDSSDWDKDGISDWDELAAGLPPCADPFKSDNCGVGGVAELPDVATTPLEAGGSSGSNVGLIAAVAAAVAAGAFTLGGAAVYARRRLS